MKTILASMLVLFLAGCVHVECGNGVNTDSTIHDFTDTGVGCKDDCLEPARK